MSISHLVVEERYCEGHFPGRPIVPGVAQLELVRRALAPPGVPLREIRHARFKLALAPAQPLELKAREIEPCRFRATLTAAQQTAMTADLRFEDLARVHFSDEPAPPGPALAPLELLIPHRPPMRFVERVLARDDAGAQALCRIPANCPLVRDAAAPALAAVEAAAQTAAVWQAMGGESETIARLGYLVSLRDTIFETASFPIDRVFRVSISAMSLQRPLCTFAFEVLCGAQRLAGGSIGTYLAE